MKADHIPENRPANQETAQAYRILPHNLEAEQGLLGALLVNNNALEDVGDFLRADHFFMPAHARIYEAITSFAEQGKVASPVSLKNLFQKDRDLKKAGGAEYLADLAASVVSVTNARDYAQTICDLYLRRELIMLCEETREAAFVFDHDRDVRNDLEDHEAGLFSLIERGAPQTETVAFGDSITAAIELAQKACKRDGHISGVTTGLSDIDHILGGLQASDLVILAGRPSMGKTALATNIAFNAALKHLETEGWEGAAAALFSLEMSHEQISIRILANLARISSDKIRKGLLEQKDFRSFIQIGQQFSGLPLYMDDSAAVSISALRTKARRMKRKYNIGLLVVDYLQLLSASPAENRTQEISRITRGLKAIAKDLHIPVLALSQLSREVEKREDKRPLLSDLRDSGSIEQDADVVMFVYRDGYYLDREEAAHKAHENPEKYEEWRSKKQAAKNITELIIAKQRNGPVDTVELSFDPDLTRFDDLEKS